MKQKKYDHRINKVEHINKVAYIKTDAKSIQICSIQITKKKNRRFSINYCAISVKQGQT